MNIFTSQKELKKWAISMANACGGMEVVQNNIIKKQSPKKIENLTNEDKNLLSTFLSPSVTTVLSKVAPEIEPLLKQFTKDEENVVLPGSIVKTFANRKYPGVEIVYDSKITNFENLLNIFWKNIDPFDKAGQFCDKGYSYRSVAFYQNQEKKKLMSCVKKIMLVKLLKSGVNIT